MMDQLLRRTIPNDHSCLFTAIGYLAEGTFVQQGAKLRQVCADMAVADPDTFGEWRLGKPTAEYTAWVRNHFNWGGETEAYMLATHFKIELVIVSLEGMVLKYNSDAPDLQGRGFLLYTGQHYDALVGAQSEETTVADEVRLHPVGDEDSELLALAAAKVHKAERDFRATQRVVKKMKCECGAIVDDNDAFQVHCAEVEHGDDFSYMCDEIEVVESMVDDDPTLKIDLSSDNVMTWYNGPQSVFSNFYPSAVTIDGKDFATVEHYWQYSKVVGVDDEVAEKIRTAETIQKAHLAGAYAAKIRDDWDEVKAQVLKVALVVKFDQHPALKVQLLATAGKQLVNIDSDKWAGISESDGIQTGNNNVGKILTEVRDEFIAQAAE